LTVDSPVVIQESPKVAARLAPQLGEHTEQVLAELGFNAAQIDDLRANGAIPHTWHQAATAAETSKQRAIDGRIL
jgi:formyl-CoA transferase